jgi:hypothetical protein
MEVQMFRLIKLGFYFLIGYALYELYQGMTNGDFSRSRGQGGGSSDLNRALNEDSGRMQTLTGPGEGRREETLDNDGGSVGHMVGRGVTTG